VNKTSIIPVFTLLTTFQAASGGCFTSARGEQGETQSRRMMLV